MIRPFNPFFSVFLTVEIVFYPEMLGQFITYLLILQIETEKRCLHDAKT